MPHRKWSAGSTRHHAEPIDVPSTAIADSRPSHAPDPVLGRHRAPETKVPRLFGTALCATVASHTTLECDARLPTYSIFLVRRSLGRRRDAEPEQFPKYVGGICNKAEDRHCDDDIEAFAVKRDIRRVTSHE